MRVGWIIVAFAFCHGAVGRAADDWHRVACIDDPRLAVTLLLKRAASPADEEFIGFELHNRTDAPLRIGPGTRYRLDDVRLAARGDRRPVADTHLASGNVFDLLWRDAERPPDEAPRDGERPPREGPRDDSIPPGITRRLRYCSAYSLALLGWPRGEGLSVAGRAHMEVGMPDGTAVATPAEGVPFRFDWLPPDPGGIASMGRRLRRTLAEPADPFGDAAVMRVLLADPRTASAATVDELLDGLKRHGQVSRPVIREHLDRHFAADERVIAFCLDVIRSRDRLLLLEISKAERVRDARLVEPLLQWLRDDERPRSVTDFALAMLRRHRDLMADRRAVTAELGRLVLAQSPQFAAGGPARESEFHTIAMTGDESLVPRLVPYLDRTEVVVDARQVAVMNNGVSTRACDLAYNTILNLLDRPGERFSMELNRAVPAKRPAREEYARRDALIGRLRAELRPPA